MHDGFDSYRSHLTVWNSELQRYECQTIRGQVVFDGYQYINRKIREVLGPLSLARKVKLGEVMRQFVGDNRAFAAKNPEIAATTTLVDSFGVAHFAASLLDELSIPIVFSVAGCMGVAIKDEAGNVTAAHINPMQKYNILTVRQLLAKHQEIFGKASNIRLAVSGMNGTRHWKKRHLKKKQLRENFSRLLKQYLTEWLLKHFRRFSFH